MYISLIHSTALHISQDHLYYPKQETALTLASYHGHADIVKVLLEKGAKFNKKAMKYAVTTGNV